MERPFFVKVVADKVYESRKIEYEKSKYCKSGAIIKRLGCLK